MRANDRIILLIVPLLALAAAFWFLLIAPKRDEASQLQTEIETTQASIDAAEAQIAVAEKARSDFPKTYGQLVELGRAVPEDDDQSTLVYDMSGLGKQNKLDFRSFEVVQGNGQHDTAAARCRRGDSGGRRRDGGGPGQRGRRRLDRPGDPGDGDAAGHGGGRRAAADRRPDRPGRAAGHAL